MPIIQPLHSRTMLKILLRAAVLCFAAVVLSGCRTRSFLSTRQEINLGREGSRQIEQEYRVDVSSPDAERVRKVGQRLLPHIDKRDVPYSFKVLEVKDVNALSLPGGPVYVYRGLLDMLGDDDDALACILGHEVGHVNGRHAARQISSRLATNVLIGLAVPTATGQNLAGLGAEIVGLSYGREDEYDADRRGLSYAHFAGYNPKGMIRFFKRLQQLEKRTGSAGPEWLNNHPVTGARISKAEMIIENNNFRFGQ